MRCLEDSGALQETTAQEATMQCQKVKRPGPSQAKARQGLLSFNSIPWDLGFGGISLAVVMLK